MNYLKEKPLHNLLNGVTDLEKSKKIRVFFAESVLNNATDFRLIEVVEMMKRGEWTEALKYSVNIYIAYNESRKTIRNSDESLYHAETIWMACHFDAPLSEVHRKVIDNSSTEDEDNLYDSAINFVTDLQNS